MTKVFNPNNYITWEQLVEDVVKYAESKATNMKAKLRKDRINANKEIAYV
jgi:hypothetical protein